MLHHLTTEQRNPASEKIDTLSSREIVELINSEDASVPIAVGRQSEQIAQAVDAITDRIRRGGRLLYLGAGTSGRLGVLDASECPPTFNTPPELVVGIIAGGPAALTRAIEGAEDHPEQAERDLRAHQLGAADCLVGIATSGRTPYVIGGLEFAGRCGSYRIGLSCNDASSLAPHCELTITPIVGPEVITGSTRMKAGTATKMVLNMLTTATMVRLGKTYGNLMVDLRATNNKLRQRSRRIVAELTGLDEPAAERLLAGCDGEVKTAIVMQRCNVNAPTARQRLAASDGRLRGAIEAPLEQ